MNPPTICKCGAAKIYHRPEDHRDHDYEPRYEPKAWLEGYRKGYDDGVATGRSLGEDGYADWGP